MVGGDGVLGSLLLADGGAAGRVVGVVTVHEAVVWSDAPLLRGAVSESAETASSHVRASQNLWLRIVKSGGATIWAWTAALLGFFSA